MIQLVLLITINLDVVDMMKPNEKTEEICLNARTANNLFFDMNIFSAVARDIGKYLSNFSYLNRTLKYLK